MSVGGGSAVISYSPAGSTMVATPDAAVVLRGVNILSRLGKVRATIFPLEMGNWEGSVTVQVSTHPSCTTTFPIWMSRVVMSVFGNESGALCWALAGMISAFHIPCGTSALNVLSALLLLCWTVAA